MYARILVPVDGSDTSRRGLAEAVALAKLSGGRLRLMHVLDLMPMATGAAEGYVGPTAETLALIKQGGEQMLAQARDTVEAANVAVDTVLVESFDAAVADRIVEEAANWGAELIVMGTHGRRGVRRLMLGSDAERVLRLASTPVLLVRAAPAA